MNLSRVGHCALVAVIAASLFVILSLPVTFSVTSKAFPSFIQMGAPSTVGVVAHAGVFLVVFFGLLCMLRGIAPKSS